MCGHHGVRPGWSGEIAVQQKHYRWRQHREMGGGAKERQFLQGRMDSLPEEEQDGGRAGSGRPLCDRQERALSRSGPWERDEDFWRSCARHNAVRNSEGGSFLSIHRTQRCADHVTEAQGAVPLAGHGNRRGSVRRGLQNLQGKQRSPGNECELRAAEAISGAIRAEYESAC